jgi:hypothetical protein
MTTATYLIGGALSKLGVNRAGDPIDPDDEPLGLSALNTLIDSLNLPGGFAYTNTDVSATLGIGAASLTIGPAMSLATVRPVRIEVGSRCTLSGVDYEMWGIDEAQYNAIPVKDTQGIPRRFWLDSGAATGTVYYYPTPAVSVVVHHPVQQQASEFADMTTDYVLPQGCERALLYALAVELAPDYETQPSETVLRTAANSMREFKRANVVIPKLRLNANIPGANRLRGGWYLG